MDMSLQDNGLGPSSPATTQLNTDDVANLLLSVLSDGLDHPELWAMIPDLLVQLPDLPRILGFLLDTASDDATRVAARLLRGVCGAVLGDLNEMIALIEPMGADYSQSALVQGAIFHLHGLRDPANPKYALTGKFCEVPFRQLDILETSTHLCCASWLQTSAGDLSGGDWQAVWNGETARAIRASFHDGSYRYCNKGACPRIQSDTLVPADNLAARSRYWADMVAAAETLVPRGPEVVNLAYDRTCNLSCPSCRVDRFAADDAMRARFAEMQKRAILPLLKDAKTVFVTGSGDPFASKNFRHLMTQLTKEDYPELGFQIMTNGMLFTPRQWKNFPTLHGRVKILKISIDAATGATHELLRRGARWVTMLENMTFAGSLTAAGLVDHFELVFTVQAENYREMGDAVDLAKAVGATGVYFARITNWGTFTIDEYRGKAIFLPIHADYGDFRARMQDPRLKDPIVLIGDLEEFVDALPSDRRRIER